MSDLKRTPQPTFIGLPNMFGQQLDAQTQAEWHRLQGANVAELQAEQSRNLQGMADAQKAADAWKLQPYRDVYVPTPSGNRPLRQRGESTPVHIPPARRTPPKPIPAPPLVVPSQIAIWTAAVVVCYLLALLMALTLVW